MKSIPLSRDKFAVVDDEDFERLSAHKWSAANCVRKNRVIWFAVRQSKKSEGKPRAILMHREIVGVAGKQTDHKNGDGLDNRRDNLRPASQMQNSQNAHKHIGTSSRFKGVSWFARDSLWRAVIQRCGKYVHLGYFANDLDAARAYDTAALKFFGEFALTNKSLQLL